MAAYVDHLRLIEHAWRFTVTTDPADRLPGVLAVLTQAIPAAERSVDVHNADWTIQATTRNKAILRSMFANFAREADALARQGALCDGGKYDHAQRP